MRAVLPKWSRGCPRIKSPAWSPESHSHPQTHQVFLNQGRNVFILLSGVMWSRAGDTSSCLSAGRSNIRWSKCQWSPLNLLFPFLGQRSTRKRQARPFQFLKGNLRPKGLITGTDGNVLRDLPSKGGHQCPGPPWGILLGPQGPGRKTVREHP